MHDYVPRKISNEIEIALSYFPVVCVLGPRQCGKSTLVKHLASSKNALVLDLQSRSDQNKLKEHELFFDQYRDKLICLDEIQQLPDFFNELRSEVDRDRRPGRFLILGSASRELLRQSNESLAGRVSFHDLSPFQYREISSSVTIRDHWNRGGFPDSTLAPSDSLSQQWRENFIRTFLERDIPSFGIDISTTLMAKLWRYLAHTHGQTINYSKMATDLEFSIPTCKRYLSILENTYMIRTLPPREANIKKRMIKAPKLFIRDSGLLHSLLDINGFDELLAHPHLGASWEGYAIENILTELPSWNASFIRTSHGAEADLLLERKGKLYLVECKASKAPKLSRGTHHLIQDLQPTHSFLVSPVDETYALNKKISVTSPNELLQILSCS
jgi:predicted AAA+ superfamily ATPase